MGVKVRVGRGSKIVFADSKFAAEVVSYALGGISRDSIDATHQESPEAAANQIGNMEFVPDPNVDAGTLTLEIHFDPNDVPPVHGDPEDVTLTFRIKANEKSSVSWSGKAFATTYDASVPLQGKCTGSLGLKWAGSVTRTRSTV